MSDKRLVGILTGLILGVGQVWAVETSSKEAAQSCEQQARQAGIKEAEDISEYVHECLMEEKARQTVEKPDVRTVTPDSEGA